MFRRKRSTSRHQPLSTVNSQSAQSAATHAFLKSQPSSSSLSSAAAAAALRSLTPTPTPVENVQTKRMLQRRASVTSQTSMTGSLRPGSRTALRRSNSSSSMSNRTFREQSPHRPATSNGQVDVVPPLPSMPPGLAGRTNPVRRSVSLEPSVRFNSSPTHKTLGRGMSVDRSLRSSSSQSPIQSQPLSTVPELERTSSRNSINFSYPMTGRPVSPTVSRPFPTQSEALTNVPLNHELSPAGSPNARIAKSQEMKKAAGLITGSPGRTAPSVGTAVAAAQAAVVPKSDGTGHSPVANRFVNHREAATNTHAQSQASRQVSSHATGPKRTPTVPEEDFQGEERAGPDGIGSRVNHSRAGSVSPIDDLVPNSSEHLYAAEPSIIRTPATPDEKDVRPTYPVQSMELNESARLENGLQQSPIPYSSSSPGRSARFSSQLAVTGIAEHRPPPRSVSPVKSALKNARKSSLSPDGRNGGVLRPGPSISELSDATSVASDDGSRLGYRRKAVKVSFDDDTEIVGVAASPPTSPEELTPEPPEKFRSRTGWFGVVKRKTSQGDTVHPDEFDEVLKPRPALPSFGSIRGRREDEPEPAQPDFSDNESTASSDFDAVVSGWSVSNDHVSKDHAVQGIMSNPSVTNHQPGTEVDDIALADSSQGPKDQTSSALTHDGDLGHEPVSQVSQALKPSVAHAHLMREQGPLMTPDVELALQGVAAQTTSPAAEKGRSSLEIYRVPGGFPRTSLELDPKAASKRTGKRRSRGKSIDERMPNGKESDDESGESVYSDAEEGVDGDGFGSINAIVDARIAQGKDGRPVDSLLNNTFSKDDTRGFGAKSTNGTANRLGESSQADPAQAQPADSPTSPQAFPTRSTVQTQTTANDIHWSARASQPKRPMSTIVYSDSGLRDDVAKDGSLRELSGNGTSVLRRADSERAKKRPVSFGPVIQKEIDPAPSSERLINGRTPYMPQRRMSTGSDSSSSFIRSTRRARKGGQHTMRRTMRGGPPIRAMPPSPGRASSPSIESRPLSSGSVTGTMRTTLRSSGPKNDKTSSFFSSRSPRTKATKTATPRFVSRFPDSDDEDADFQQRKFQRRYDDSSDDEPGRVMHTLRPVRGIPRRQGTNDGDSTELEDSSENEGPATPAAAAVSKKSNIPSHDPGLAAVARSRGMTEEELDEFLHRPAKGRVSGILGRFTLKKSRPPMEHKASKSNPEDLVHMREENLLNPGRGTTVTTVSANHSGASPSKLTKGGLKKANGNSRPTDSGRKGSEAAADAGTVAEQHPVAVGASGDGIASIAHHSEPTAGDSAVNMQGSEPAPPREEPHSANSNGSNNISAKDIVFPQGGRKKRFPRLRKAFGMRS
ncbi:woronin body major protein [Aspergillus udagawae]|uniref:Woronin body major protein n=1 Tax=Aspergillus udagawae TaxID=91492 RepID=A0A8H3XRU9_9EURO|nr:woronin body major protein [Aspergillus udagawae]